MLSHGVFSWVWEQTIEHDRQQGGCIGNGSKYEHASIFQCNT